LQKEQDNAKIYKSQIIMSETYKSENKFEIPDFYPTVRAIEGTPQLPIKQEFTIPGLKEALVESSESFFLKPEFMRDLSLDNYLLRSARFTDRSDWRIGREDSSQQVFFGELDLTVDKGSAGESRVVPIAIKPYCIKKRAAIHEFVALDLINEHRNMEAYHPIGFWAQDPKNIFLLTMFEAEVQTLDNINWQLNGSDTLNEHFEPFGALRACASILARMHSQGYAHRDAQIKNMGVDGRGIRIVDLTQMRRISIPDFSDDMEARLMVLEDFEKLTDSVNKNYLSDVDSSRKRQIIEANLVEPYLSMMRHPSLSFASDVEFHKALNSIAETTLERI
jgi:tRNA A-37 threonylcarbamoyl transferase component Bud32